MVVTSNVVTGLSLTSDMDSYGRYQPMDASQSPTVGGFNVGVVGGGGIQEAAAGHQYYHHHHHHNHPHNHTNYLHATNQHHRNQHSSTIYNYNPYSSQSNYAAAAAVIAAHPGASGQEQQSVGAADNYPSEYMGAAYSAQTLRVAAGNNNGDSGVSSSLNTPTPLEQIQSSSSSPSSFYTPFPQMANYQQQPAPPPPPADCYFSLPPPQLPSPPPSLAIYTSDANNLQELPMARATAQQAAAVAYLSPPGIASERHSSFSSLYYNNSARANHHHQQQQQQQQRQQHYCSQQPEQAIAYGEQQAGAVQQQQVLYMNGSDGSAKGWSEATETSRTATHGSEATRQRLSTLSRSSGSTALGGAETQRGCPPPAPPTLSQQHHQHQRPSSSEANKSGEASDNNNSSSKQQQQRQASGRLRATAATKSSAHHRPSTQPVQANGGGADGTNSSGNSHNSNKVRVGPLGIISRRKNATRETTSTLKDWLDEHDENPYPTKGEKIMLSIITKMSLTQVSTWFANARRRMKKANKVFWGNKAAGQNGTGASCPSLSTSAAAPAPVGGTASIRYFIHKHQKRLAGASSMLALAGHPICQRPFVDCAQPTPAVVGPVFPSPLEQLKQSAAEPVAHSSLSASSHSSQTEAASSRQPTKAPAQSSEECGAKSADTSTTTTNTTDGTGGGGSSSGENDF